MIDKSILLLYKNENMSKVFEKGLAEAGFRVFPLIVHPIDYFAFTPLERVTNIFRRIILRDKSYFARMQRNVWDRYYKKRVRILRQNKTKFDYCLAVHAGMFPEDLISFARDISGRMVDYQPDGVKPDDAIFRYQKYFDRIFVFDENDLQKYPNMDFAAATNFHMGAEKAGENTVDLYYVGARLPERVKILEDLAENLDGLTTNFILGINWWEPAREEKGIKYTPKGYSYFENLGMTKHAAGLIDLKRPEHDGLSFRFFEAMAYGKKVITNNAAAENYGFYHADNIHITRDFRDYAAIRAFMQRPTHGLPKETVDYYAFKNWVRRLLEP